MQGNNSIIGKNSDNRLPSTSVAPKLTSSTPNSLVIFWEPLNGYKLQVGRNNFSQIIADKVVNGINFTINNLEPVTIYDLQISAYSLAEESPFEEAV